VASFSAERGELTLVGAHVEVVTHSVINPASSTSNTPAIGSSIQPSPMRNRSSRSLTTTEPTSIWRRIRQSTAAAGSRNARSVAANPSRPTIGATGTFS
jgi:hypothetical protein